MSVGQDAIGGAMLEYVARAVTGDMFVETCKFNDDINKNERQSVKLKQPVIVFFAHKGAQVFPLKEAERLGFLEQPTILNLQDVDDPKSVAGQFKFAVSVANRDKAWMKMEQHLINQCIQKTGIPLPRANEIDPRSLYTGSTVMEEFVDDQVE